MKEKKTEVRQMDVSDMFEQVCCINLDRRPDRWQSFRAGLPRDWPFGEVQRVSAVDGAKVPPPAWWQPGEGAWGCYRTHLNVIERALNEGRESILIFEDDAVFPQDFSSRAAAFLRHVPDDWGMLYLGGEHLKREHVPPKIVNEQVCIPHNVNRTHAFALRGETLRAVYRHLTSDAWKAGHHIDHHLGRFLEHHDRRYPVYCPRKWLVGQAAGDSNIANRLFPERFWQADDGVDPQQQPFVAILGMHSSGSSALAGVAWGLGVHLGRQLGGHYGNRPGDKCGYEAAELAEICESAIPFPSTESVDDPFYDPTPRLQDWINEARCEAHRFKTIAGGKYPQLCRLGSSLRRICGDQLRVIVSERDPDDAVRSLQKRFPAMDSGAIEAHQRWLLGGLRQILDGTPSARKLVVRYEDLLDDPEQQAERMVDFLGVKSDRMACLIARAVAHIKVFAFQRAAAG